MSKIVSRKDMLPTWEAEAKTLLAENKSKAEIKEALFASGAQSREVAQIVGELTQSTINKMGKLAYAKLKEGLNDEQIHSMLASEFQATGLIEDGMAKGRKLLLGDIRKEVLQLVKDRHTNEEITQHFSEDMIGRERLEKMLVNVRDQINSPLQRQFNLSLIAGVLLLLLLVTLFVVAEDPSRFMGRVTMWGLVLCGSAFISCFTAWNGMRK